MDALLALMGIHMMAVMSPGPDFAIVVKNALQCSRRQGVYAAIGIGLGLLVHLSYCLTGLGLLIQRFPFLFVSIQVLGGFYLLYLSYHSFKSAKVLKEASWQSFSGSTSTSIKSGLKEGFLTNLLNAKATLFLLSIYTQIFSAQWPKERVIILTVFIIFSSVAWFSFLAVTVGTGKIKTLLRNYKAQMDKAMGVLLAFIALRIFMSLF